MKQFLRDYFRGNSQSIISYVLALFIAFLLGAVLIAFGGENPLTAYKTIFAGAFGDRLKTASTLARATPLILTGLAVAIAFKTGVANIGAEGQLFLGGFAAAWVGFTLHGLPSFLHIGLCMVAAMIIGSLWASIPVILKISANTNEVVTTIMANYIAILITTYLVNHPFKVPDSVRSATVYIDDSAKLFRPIRFSAFSTGFIIAVLLVIIVYFFMKKTTLGYEWKMVGLNPLCSRYSGIPVKRAMLIGMLISGALAGLAGGIEVMGVHHRFVDNISPGYGFDGMLIALLAGNNVIGVFFAAVLFAAIGTGSIGMEQATIIPSEISDVLQSLLILSVAVQAGITYYLTRVKKTKHHTAESVEDGVKGDERVC